MVGFGGVEIEDAALKGRQYKSVREKRTGLKTRHYPRKKMKEAGLKSWPYTVIANGRSFASLWMTTFGVWIVDDCCSVGVVDRSKMPP